MVWLRIILFFFIFVSSVNSSELNQQEISYFKIIDLNNDGYVSVEEIKQSLDIIFQLIDVNKDQLISLSEKIQLINNLPNSKNKEKFIIGTGQYQL